MKLSFILNTAVGDPLVSISKDIQGNTYRSRASALKQTLSSLDGFDEVIVSGVYEDSPHYKYIHCQPIYRNRIDALYQRELGARHSTGDVLVFCHDDHRPGEGFAHDLRYNYCRKFATILPKWDILVPKRVDLQGQELNNGKDDNYMGGHCLIMKRSVWAEHPWTSIETEWWDRAFSDYWRSNDVRIEFVDDLVHVDLTTNE